MTLAKGAPLDLESINDATFNRDPASDVYGIMLSYAGGAVLHKTKLFRCAVGSAHEGEAIPTVMGSDFLAVGREALRSMGDPQDQPSFLGTDNFANALIASNEGNATRSRHFLRRYYVLLQRVKAGDNVIGHVPDTENPSDFLTKWVSKAKLQQSLLYLTNANAIKGDGRRRVTPLEVSVLTAVYGDKGEG